MKHRKILLVLLAAAVVLLLGSCDQLMSSLFGVTIEGRIESFRAALNEENRDDMQEHFHPDMTNYQQLADPKVFDGGPLAYANSTFVFGVPDVEDDVAVCSYLDGNGATGTIEFTMKRDGLNYKIFKLKLTLDSSSTVYELKRVLE